MRGESHSRVRQRKTSRTDRRGPTLERARRLVAVNRYGAVTLDLTLADGDGATLIAELRAAAGP